MEWLTRCTVSARDLKQNDERGKYSISPRPKFHVPCPLHHTIGLIAERVLTLDIPADCAACSRTARRSRLKALSIGPTSLVPCGSVLAKRRGRV